MRDLIPSLTMLLLAVVGAPPPCGVDTTFDDDFSSDPAPRLAVTELAQWNVTQGNVDVVRPGTVNCPLSVSGNCVDLDGTGSRTGALLSSIVEFEFKASSTYRLVIEIPAVNTSASNTDNFDAFVVRLGELYERTFDDYSVPLVIDTIIRAEKDSAGRIQIEMLPQPNNIGPLLASVQLECISGPSPIRFRSWGSIKAGYADAGDQ